MEKLFVISDVRVVPGKGLVLSPPLRDVPFGLAVGATLEMARPDGGRLRTKVVALDREGSAVRVCVLPGAAVGPGTRVWLDAGVSGVFVKATGAPAAGAIHRSPAGVPRR